MQATPSPDARPGDTPREPLGRRRATTGLVPGRVVGGSYAIKETLGQGGMGQVYLARDERLDRDVALKVLPPDQADAEARARFLREARALGRIEHDNVVRVFASGEDDDGLAWMALEVVAGEPLSALADGGAIDEETALLLAAQIARGLAAVHAQGVVHRDVKPSNVLVDDDATVKLIDFGVASLEGRQGGFTTRAGVVVGTPHFMSPEQARGGAVDARADAWGLGATLYALLAGVPPFFGGDDEADLDILARVVRDDVPDIREKAPQTSAATAAVVGALLSRDVERRPADLGAVADRLEGIVGGTHVEAAAAPTDPTAAPTGLAPPPAPVASPDEPLGAVVPVEAASSASAGGGVATVVVVLVVVVAAVGLGAFFGQRLAPPQERIVERVVEVPVERVVEVPVEVRVPVEVPVVPPPSVTSPPLPQTPDELEVWAASLGRQSGAEQEALVRELFGRGDVAAPALGRLIEDPAPVGDRVVDVLDEQPAPQQDALWVRALSSSRTPRGRALRVVERLAARRNDTALVALQGTAREHKDPVIRAAAARAADSIFRVDE